MIVQTIHDGVQRLRLTQGPVAIRVTERVLGSMPADYRSAAGQEVTRAIGAVLPAGISRLESGARYCDSEKAVIRASAARLVEREVPLHVMVPAIMSALPECRFILDFAFRGVGRAALLVVSERMVAAVAEAAEVFVAAYCLHRLRGGPQAVVDRGGFEQQDVGRPDAHLTDRQAQVLELVAQGLSNEDIAGELNTSVRTVRNHLYRVYPAIGVSSRSDATRWWWTTAKAG